jgi:hypothetical protein
LLGSLCCVADCFAVAAPMNLNCIFH